MIEAAAASIPTSNQNPATIVWVPRAPPVLLTAFHGPRGGDGALLLLQEASGQAAVGVLVFLALLQPDPLRLLVVPNLHARFVSCSRSSSPFLSLCEMKGEIAENA